jgi:hypothetical protein
MVERILAWHCKCVKQRTEQKRPRLGKAWPVITLCYVQDVAAGLFARHPAEQCCLTPDIGSHIPAPNFKVVFD